jgi:hypothetical protein
MPNLWHSHSSCIQSKTILSASYFSAFRFLSVDASLLLSVHKCRGAGGEVVRQPTYAWEFWVWAGFVWGVIFVWETKETTKLKDSVRSKRFCIWDRRIQTILAESVRMQNIFDLVCVSHLKDRGCRNPKHFVFETTKCKNLLHLWLTSQIF